MNTEPARQTGITTRQMQSAPQGAVYVWLNGNLSYPRELAERMGRGDLQIISVSEFTVKRVAGAFASYVIDHAVRLDRRGLEALDLARQRFHSEPAAGPVSCLERRDGRDYLRFQPHGYEFPIELPVITHGSRDAANAWTWNGSTESPTLKPSVKTTHADGKVSHIWLTDGMCQHLSDSTDGLAGQTLPLRQLEPEL